MRSLRFNAIVMRTDQTHRRDVVRSRGFSPLAALLVVIFPAGCSSSAGGNHATARGLRIATLNLAHGRAVSPFQSAVPPDRLRANIDLCADVIARDNPDIIALQEADAPAVWSGAFHHVDRIAKRAALPHVHHGIHFDQGLGPIRVAYGTALLSQQELKLPTSLRFEFGHLHTKGFVSARIEHAGRPLIVVSVHLTSGSAAVRRQEVNVMVEALAKVDAPIVLMGDLNSQWKNENDAVRLLAARLRLRAFEPDSPGQLTFRAGRPKIRIDWILIAPEFEFVQYRTWTDLVSDHLGVSATIRWVE
ncbi:MAG: endonuclease/exonuclease/phosphatase family protein [Planctomycetes bacterium]|nr:endonuclease/exonuclease/phosphatase family protein [Planctomycetota bacterium]